MDDKRTPVVRCVCFQGVAVTYQRWLWLVVGKGSDGDGDGDGGMP